MSDQNKYPVYKNLPPTSQELTDELDSKSAKAFAMEANVNSGKPYDQDLEQPNTNAETAISMIDELVPRISNTDFLKELRRDTELRDMAMGIPAVHRVVDIVDVGEAEPAGVVEQAELTLAFNGSTVPTDGVYMSPPDQHIADISPIIKKAADNDAAQNLPPDIAL